MSDSNQSSLNEILALQGAEFDAAFFSYLIAKKIKSGLTGVEEEAWLLMVMRLDIEMEGFVDLFYQQYSLRKCSVVETVLRNMDLHHLADLFGEAKKLFTGGKTEITEEEYRNINWSDDNAR